MGKMESSLFKTNDIFKTIKAFHEMFPDEFSKCDIKPCGHCNGTGIANKSSLIMCSICGGIGYRGFEKLRNQFVCRACNGGGCSTCNESGTVDWITHANGSDINTNRKMESIW